MRSIAIAAALLAAQAAGAQCTELQYVGAPFSAITASANNTESINSPLVGRITLATPLPPNASNLTVSPSAWDFTLENSNYTSANNWFTYYYYSVSFAFTTDANGNITDWNINIQWTNQPGTENLYIISTTSKASGDEVEVNFKNLDDPSGPMTISGDSNVAGTWTCVASYTTSYTAPPPPPPPVNPLAAQVAQLQAQVASLQSQVANLKTVQGNYQWQATGWKARAETLTQQLANAKNEIAVLQAELKKK
jgi:hypothetical protein